MANQSTKRELKKYLDYYNKILKEVFHDFTEDDWFDRLSCLYTSIGIMCMGIGLIAWQWFFRPIVCWCPANFKRAWIKYVNSYCWVTNTYYLQPDQEIPRHSDQRDHEIAYYQYIVFLLFFQASLYYVPSRMWHFLNTKSGVDLKYTVTKCRRLGSVELDDKDTKGKDKASDDESEVESGDENEVTSGDENKVELKVKMKSLYKNNEILDDLLNILDRYMSGRATYNKGCLWHICSKRCDKYLIAVFFLVKMVYLFNAVGQFFMLRCILFDEFSFHGYNYIFHPPSDDPGEFNGSQDPFPKVVFCDFHIRSLGNVNRYTVQCILLLNKWNETIYAVLWFWMIFVAVATTFGLLYWLLLCVCKSDGRQFVLNHLVSYDANRNADITFTDEKIDRFINNYLKPDGLFLLRFISHKSNPITTNEITQGLWMKWESKFD